ncbi:hypothetical protein MBLNU457_3953t2 [Dothideomycetes sp. NU457]
MFLVRIFTVLALCLFVPAIVAAPKKHPPPPPTEDAPYVHRKDPTSINEFDASVPCRNVSLVHTRGSHSPGNIGKAAVFFDELAMRIGYDALAVQGVKYPASYWDYFWRRTGKGKKEILRLLKAMRERCPDTQFILSGFSQGARVIRRAAETLSDEETAWVQIVLLFGDPEKQEDAPDGFVRPSVGNIHNDKVLEVCHPRDRTVHLGKLSTSVTLISTTNIDNDDVETDTGLWSNNENDHHMGTAIMSEEILSEVQYVGDLGLACLLCLIAEQHGIITASNPDDVANVLEGICRDAFHLSVGSVDCANGLTLDEFRQGVLVPSRTGYDSSPMNTPHYERSLPSFAPASKTRPRTPSLDDRKIANVVIARNLDQADYYVQIQALELIRTKRLFSHTAMHHSSKVFVLIALNDSSSSRRMDPHLNDLFSICHHHEAPTDGSESDAASIRRQPSLSDAASFSSVLRSQPSRQTSYAVQSQLLSHADLEQLRLLASKVTITAEVSAYIHNVVISMRLHRYVAGGISALATRHLKNTVRAMAVLHGLSYVTPSLVGLAAQKTYPHRLILATSDTERSIRWGSDPAAVAQNMKGVTTQSAILAVLDSVETPL